MASHAKALVVPGRWIVSLRPYATKTIKTNHVSLVSTLTADPAIPFHCDINHHFDLPELRGYSAKFDEETKNRLEEMDEVRLHSAYPFSPLSTLTHP